MLRQHTDTSMPVVWKNQEYVQRWVDGQLGTTGEAAFTASQPVADTDSSTLTATDQAVLQALADPHWDFRTVEGISRDTGLAPATVEDVLQRQSHRVRQALVLGPHGRPIYTLRSKPVSLRERLSALVAVLAKSNHY